jgi:hypothetical protein
MRKLCVFIAQRVIVLVAALMATPLVGCAATYRADAIEGTVVDAETSAPIEGVIVLAHWELNHRINGVPIEQVEIMEAVTAVNGRYSFPAWGPRVVLTSGNMRYNSPGIVLFKPGYKSAGFSNLYYTTEGTEKFFYNQKTLKLERFKGSPAEYAKHLSSLSSSLESVGYRPGDYSGDYCGWKRFPKMLGALSAAENSFQAAGVRHGTFISFLRANETLIEKQGCGSVSEFLRGIGK